MTKKFRRTGSGDPGTLITAALLDGDMRLLRRLEYEMGNGQCAVCCGANPNGQWDGHPCHPTRASQGHKKNCKLAKRLKLAGYKVVYRS